jgi:hypothetical protein
MSDEIKDIVLHIGMRVPLGNSEMTFQTAFPRDTDVAALNAYLDLLEGLAGRQLAKQKLAMMEMQADDTVRRLGAARDDLTKLVHTPPGAAPKNRGEQHKFDTQIVQTEGTVKHLREEHEKLQAMISSLKKVVGLPNGLDSGEHHSAGGAAG